MRSKLGLLLICAAASAAQQPAPPNFRVGTQLVQVSVIAQDKQGMPIADLQQKDFQVFDNGVRQELKLFYAESEKPSAEPPTPLPPNTFTNQTGAPEGSRTGYSVILIDNLITNFGDPTKNEEGSGAAIERTLRMLRSIRSGERIAIYALQRKLQIICEFTADRDLLERQLRNWKVSVDTPGIFNDIFGDGTNPGDATSKETAEAARMDMLRRTSTSNDEMLLVAEHLAGIPGRKNLIWLADAFPLSRPALQKLSDAGVAIYPVDAEGVCDFTAPACANRPKGEMNAIAAATGGIAYLKRNDLDIASREALDDGRVSYTLGFYASGDPRMPPVHQLSVRVNRRGVSLRYRASYQAEQPQPAADNPVADVLTALNRPFDTNTLPVTASVTRADGALKLEVLLDGASLDLTHKDDRWTAKIEFVARFLTADGKLAGDGFAQSMTLNLLQASYDSALQHGFPYRTELKIPAKAVELKLLFTNHETGKIGTVTIPLWAIQASQENAK